MREYLLDSHEEFKAGIPAGDHLTQRFIGAPRILRLYQFVNEHVRDRELAFYAPWKNRTSWDFPMSMAVLQEQAMLESDGLLSIYNWKDQQHDAYVAECEAAEAAKAEAKKKQDG